MDTRQNEPDEREKPDDVAEEMVDGFMEDKYLELIRQLKLKLQEKSNTCELLKIRLNESEQDVERLSHELNECKLAIFENNEDSRKTGDEGVKSKKLEEDYVKLMSDFLALGEQTNQYKQNLIDNYLAKSNAINSYECLKTSGANDHEIETYKTELDNRNQELNLTVAKLRHLEEEYALREKNINELKGLLDEAKVTHRHEKSTLEEHIVCLKNSITSYEKTLASYTLKEPKNNEN